MNNIIVFSREGLGDGGRGREGGGAVELDDVNIAERQQLLLSVLRL